MEMTVRSNVREVIADMRAGATEMPRATMRALNKMVDQVKVQSAREIRDAGYNLKVSDIKSALDVKRASLGNLVASLIAKGRPIPLMKYGARKASNGVSVQVLGGRKVITHAFIATMPNGHTGVFVRSPSAKHRRDKQWHALPVQELYGPSIPDGLANKAVQDVLQQYVEDRFPDLLEHELEWLRRKVGR